MQKIIKKTFIPAVIVIAVIIIVISARSCGENKKYKYEFSKISYGEVKKTISVTGTLQIMNAQIILSKINGVVQKVLVDYNQNVSKGELLSTIYSNEIDQSLTRLYNQLESSKIKLKSAESELDGKKSMFKDNLISKQGMEIAELNYKSVQYAYKQTQIEYDQALDLKKNTNIYSPINGIIITRDVEPNNPVIINRQLFQVAPSLKKMQLLISIDEADIGLIKNGQSVSFNVSAYPDNVFYGTISQVRINPIPKGGIVTYQSIVICDNEKNLLRPGMTATATIIVDTRKNVLRVSNQSFLVSPIEMETEPGKKYLWKKSSSITSAIPVQRVEVIPGLQGDMYTEIKTGLTKDIEILSKVVQIK